MLAVWLHLVLFLAYHAIGSDSSIDVARSHLQAVIVAASRARPMLPFAMQGIGALNTTIAQASELTLDAAGRRLVADLEAMRDGLQRATRSTDALSDRERTVVAELVRADSTKDLAARLHVSPNTVNAAAVDLPQTLRLVVVGRGGNRPPPRPGRVTDRVASGALAHDQFERQNGLSRRVLPRQHLQQHVGHRRTLIARRLTDGGERRRHRRGDGRVVESDDGDFVGHADAGALQRAAHRGPSGRSR